MGKSNAEVSLMLGPYNVELFLYWKIEWNLKYALYLKCSSIYTFGGDQEREKKAHAVHVVFRALHEVFPRKIPRGTPSGFTRTILSSCAQN